MRTVKKAVLYTAVQEAIDAARTYYFDPPQKKVFQDGLQERQVPIGCVSSEDWAGTYVAVECVPQPNVAPGELEA